jgi:hypothetical protein
MTPAISGVGVTVSGCGASIATSAGIAVKIPDAGEKPDASIACQLQRTLGSGLVEQDPTERWPVTLRCRGLTPELTCKGSI